MASFFATLEQSRPYRDLGPEIWEAVLEPSELLLWTGRPARGLRLTQMAAGMIAIAIAGHGVLALVLFAVMPETGSPPLGVLAILGIMSVALIAMPVLLALAETWMRDFLYYAVTDRRAVILDTQGGPPFRLTDFEIGPGMDLSISAGRLRTLWFRPRVATSIEPPRLATHADPRRLSAGLNARTRARAEITYDSSTPAAFRFLEDAEAVHDLIGQLADGTDRAASDTGT